MSLPILLAPPHHQHAGTTSPQDPGGKVVGDFFFDESDLLMTDEALAPLWRLSKAELILQLTFMQHKLSDTLIDVSEERDARQRLSEKLRILTKAVNEKDDQLHQVAMVATELDFRLKEAVSTHRQEIAAAEQLYVDARRSHEDEVGELKSQHEKQLQDKSDELQERHSLLKKLATTIAKQNATLLRKRDKEMQQIEAIQQLAASADTMEKNMKEMTSRHSQDTEALRKTHEEEILQIRTEHKAQLEEATGELRCRIEELESAVAWLSQSLSITAPTTSLRQQHNSSVCCREHKEEMVRLVTRHEEAMTRLMAKHEETMKVAFTNLPRVEQRNDGERSGTRVTVSV